MTELAQARELFKQNRFEEALGFFQNISFSENFSFDERVEAFESQDQILSSLEKKFELLKLNRSFFKFLFEQKSFSKALAISEKIIHQFETPSLEDVYSFWFCLVENGEIERAQKVGEKYFEILFARKYFQKGLQFIEEFETKLALPDLCLYYKISFLIQKGDFENLGRLVVSQKELLFKKSNRYSEKLVTVLLKLKTKDHQADFSKVLIELSLKRFLESQGNRFDLLSQKDFIHRVFDYLLCYPLDSILLSFLLSYAEKGQSRRFFDHVIKAVELTPTIFRGQKKLQRQFEDLKMESDSWPQEQELVESSENYDFADDLFKSDLADSKSELIKRLEKDLELLKKNNLKADYDLLLKRLKDLDPNHALFKNEKKVLESNESTSLNHLHLTSFDEETKSLPEKAMLVAFRKHIAYLDKAVLKENFRDYATSLFSFDAPELVLEMLENLRPEFQQEEFLDKRISLEYLYLTGLEKSSKDYDALILVDEVLNSFPLLEEEKILFHYFKGELCRKMGQKKLALASYKIVAKIDASYRLVQERMNELAQS